MADGAEGEGGELRPERIALALSGGGARAMAFHLGCLRALQKAGLLERIDTITSVSGGSVIAALYCSHPGDFESFEARVRALLARGFFWPSIATALTTSEGVKALLASLLLFLDRFCATLIWATLRPFGRGFLAWRWPRETLFIRRASRTTILRRTFDRALKGALLADLRRDRPRLVIMACELRAKAAFYFTAETLHCWRYGSASSAGIRLADAVAASAAYPLMLPAIDREMDFTKGGNTVRQRITLTDGGVYDNLGLTPLWPGRDTSISLDVGQFARLIVCRGGYALDVGDPASTFLPRMGAAFESVFARAQNLATHRLFDLTRAGEIKGFILPYLGQRDTQLGDLPQDFVRSEDVAGYGTDFFAMPAPWIDRLSRRGEQLVEALLRQEWPGFAPAAGSARKR